MPHEEEEICRIDHDSELITRFHDYQDLMRFRVSDVLLVSSLYDAFILEEDGGLSEQIYGKYKDLDLSSPPRINRVSTSKEAFEEISKRHYDLVITMSRISDSDPFEFGKKVKEMAPGTPVVLLATDASDLRHVYEPGSKNGIDKTFFWTGDSTLFLAIIKYIEDKQNIQLDTRKAMVRVILVIEDSPRYYSMFLPIIYTEIMNQTQQLISEGLNEHEKLLRRRARPKIVLAETLAEARSKFEKYREYVMGVITDIHYPKGKGGDKLDEAGFDFIESIDKEIPVLLQSSMNEYREKAEELGIPFINKNSERIGHHLKTFFNENLGFGDFIFRMEDGRGVGRARDMKDFEDVIFNIPLESLRFHGEKNHFSNWLNARGEFKLANRLRSKKVSDFTDEAEMRDFLADILRQTRREKHVGIITDFGQQMFEFEETFTKFSSGSLGGKGRGIAFLSDIMHKSNVKERFPNCHIKVPETLVLATDEFDRFINENELSNLLEETIEDGKLREKFIRCTLSEELQESLRRYLQHVNEPLAVRSSSLLEDSQNQPFAGIYSTYILPNNHPDPKVRHKQLSDAVKLVYSSVYQKDAKSYIQTTLHKSEEEKMAVVIQKLVGNRWGRYFYPVFSGVGQSFNFYPVKPLKREEGIVSVALGMGKIVVEGGKVLSFSPRHPKVIPGFSSTKDILENSQKHFFALDMEKKDFDLTEGEDVTLAQLNIDMADKDGNLDLLASTYDPQDDKIRDTSQGKGAKIITFAGILKHEQFPLPKLIENVLIIGEEGMGSPVEIEFAARMVETGHPELYIVQIRPLVTMKEHNNVSVRDEDRNLAFVYTNKALGNGINDSIRDIIYVPPEKFDRTDTLTIAEEIGELNQALGAEPFLLIGPGRWGTNDRHLGIPVRWNQISGASMIVEVSLKDFRIDPSHGSHFFHNMTSLGIPYFTVPYGEDKSFVDWEWLNSMKPAHSTRYCHHLRLKMPVVGKVNGKEGVGVILRSDVNDDTADDE